MSTQESIANKLVETISESLSCLNSDQRRLLLDKLAAAGVTPSAKGARYSRFMAEAQKPEMAPLLKLAAAQLKRWAGLTLEDAIEGGVIAVDKATKERQTSLEDRMSLKATCRRLAII
jgi:hypothetical protein